MYAYKILNLQNIIEPETTGEKTYFYIQNQYIVSANQDIGGDNAVELLELTDELKQELYELNTITEFSVDLEKQFFIVAIREDQVACIKKEAYRRITENYPITKQLNVIYEKEESQPQYIEMVIFIENIRFKSNALEELVMNMDIQDLSGLDCCDGTYWL
tara:strand:- start:83 stop:562 length:480 start_codon:yes stop_codon:yes gene_type:complete